MLGHDLQRVASQCGAVVGLGSGDTNIRDLDAVMEAVRNIAPDVTVNCAALTDVDGCEDREEDAYAINGTGAGNVARACLEAGCRMVHISTDYVFDGEKNSPYAEDDPINPISIYGASKAEGERLVRRILPDNHCIIRTQWLYGLHGRNFVETILRLAGERDRLTVVNDRHGSPTFTADLARAIYALIRKHALGTFHVTNSGITTWYDFAREIIKTSGMNHVCVEPIPSSQFPRPASRPKNAALNNSRSIDLMGSPLRPWEQALVDYMQRRSRNRS